MPQDNDKWYSQPIAEVARIFNVSLEVGLDSSGNGGRPLMSSRTPSFSICFNSSLNRFLPESVLAASTGVWPPKAGIFLLIQSS